MNIFKKSGYLRVLFVGLPFGVASLIGGTTMFNEIPETPKELILYEGVLTSFGETTYYEVELDLERTLFYVKINSEMYYADRRKERRIMESYDYKIGDSLKVWTNLNDVYVKQLIVNNQMLMVYKPPYWRAWFFTLAGILFTVMSVFYLIKYNADYFGED
ncbi:hypothetical protein QUH73_16970 [Labilibaculum sp. K2S]|uniref:hypothetical protein n=1 Tax=Labilibaculum sp. K2S TaxID=3056386 RepID=UPI0025A348C2|nr:hypothetical protein [Labilibaculum sp. K2S]MDM8161516.1 hypothetical protein [Labilibaculum sp. K2S]